MTGEAVALVILVAGINLALGGWMGWILGTTRGEKAEAPEPDDDWVGWEDVSNTSPECECGSCVETNFDAYFDKK